MIAHELKKFVQEHEHDDIHSLALRSAQYPYIDMPFAIRQILGRRIAKEKIPSWYNFEDVIYPKHLSLEQSSSEATAQYKASLVKGTTMTDLTGGLGVDFSFLSTNFQNATYIEQQKELVGIAANNFKAIGLNNIKIKCSDAIEYLHEMSPVDLIYIDPARRDTVGRKTVSIEDCTPNILEIESLLDAKSNLTMIKLSPMLDISLALKSLTNMADIYIISHNNECKELLFIRKKGVKQIGYHCVNIKRDSTDIFHFYKEQEENTLISYDANKTGKYLYEPNASILKAGAYKYISNQYKVNKLHPNSHLYTSEQYISDFQGRTFIIERISSLNKKDLKANLKDIKRANIAVRNFPMSVQELRKKTGINDGGDTYIFATTLANEDKVLFICKKAI